jgi:hypothetical protein
LENNKENSTKYQNILDLQLKLRNLLEENIKYHNEYIKQKILGLRITFPEDENLEFVTIKQIKNKPEFRILFDDLILQL